MFSHTVVIVNVAPGIPRRPQVQFYAGPHSVEAPPDRVVIRDPDATAPPRIRREASTVSPRCARSPLCIRFAHAALSSLCTLLDKHHSLSLSIARPQGTHIHIHTPPPRMRHTPLNAATKKHANTLRSAVVTGPFLARSLHRSSRAHTHTHASCVHRMFT